MLKECGNESRGLKETQDGSGHVGYGSEPLDGSKVHFWKVSGGEGAPRSLIAVKQHSIQNLHSMYPLSWHADTVNWAGLTVNCGKLGWFDGKLTKAKYLDSKMST